MALKDTFFCPKKTINCRGKLLDLSAPKVMGILNVTPDSFYDGGQLTSGSDILKKSEQFLTEGAEILDIGTYSSRPGAKEISEQKEIDRLLPAIETVRKAFPEAILSVDTFRGKVARTAVQAGAAIVNDISAGSMDATMFETVGDLKVPYIMMHMQGTPATMQVDPTYSDVLKTVLDYFPPRIAALRKLGVNDILLDPGFGFGKTVAHNYELLNNLEAFSVFELPLLVGFSRKSMLGKLLKIKAADALNATTAVNTIALMKGASILRVHDAKEAAEAAAIVSYMKNLNIAS